MLKRRHQAILDLSWEYVNVLFKGKQEKESINREDLDRKIHPSQSPFGITRHSRGARDSKIGKKWPERSRILDYILS